MENLIENEKLWESSLDDGMLLELLVVVSRIFKFKEHFRSTLQDSTRFHYLIHGLSQG
jgi:hypothetical protein